MKKDTRVIQFNLTESEKEFGEEHYVIDSHNRVFAKTKYGLVFRGVCTTQERQIAARAYQASQSPRSFC